MTQEKNDLYNYLYNNLLSFNESITILMGTHGAIIKELEKYVRQCLEYEKKITELETKLNDIKKG